MEFFKAIKKAELMAPPDFKTEIQEIEYRRDPLTGSTCIINHKRAERAKQAQMYGEISDEIIKKTKAGCFFCPEHIEEKTAKFTPSIHLEGRLKRGECIIFPNLFPFAEHHAVATFGGEHFLDLEQFDSQMIVDNMLLCQEWMLAVHQNNNQAAYPIYIWNHMPPSGASIVHPHVQAVVRETPTTGQEKLLSNSVCYYEGNGHNYWIRIVEMEKELKERFIAENDSLTVIASYAPQGFREIQFIFKGVCCFTELNHGQVSDFAKAIAKVLRGYKRMGVGSFNLITFSGPIGRNPNYFSLNAKIISRPFPQGVYSNDTGTFERLQDEYVIEYMPEDVAQKMRDIFIE